LLQWYRTDYEKEAKVGILVEKDEDQSDLHRKISADLRRRSSENALGEDIDMIEDSAYLEGTRKSSTASWFWGTLVTLAALSLIVIFALK
jgi:hypothetical protein